MRRIRLDLEIKRILKTFAVFFGIIFAMCVLIVIFSLIARNSWKTGLAVEVQKVLDTYNESHYTVGKYIDLDSNLSTSAAVYALLKKDVVKSQKYYGVIVRTPSILGPIPAVFIYNEEKGVTFVGYAIDNGKASDTVDRQIASNVMNYWENMIPLIIEKTNSK